MDTLLVLGSGQQVFREYILKTAAARQPVVLLQEQAPTWQRPYIVDWQCVPMADADQAIAAARQLAERHRLSALLTYDETAVELAATIGLILGLPYLSPACARRCRDKLAMREALAAAGVPSARSIAVASLAEAETAAAAVGYPLILKPRSLAGSIGVVRVDSPADLAAAFEMTASASLPNFHSVVGVLLEEYLDGPEVSVESVVLDGQVTVVAITRKEVGFPPYFEEIGHVVSAADPLPDESAVRAVAMAAHEALGITRGVTHTEIKLTRRGPRIVEVNARLGGDLIPHLVHLATGIDLAAAALDVAAGRSPRLTATRRAAASIRFLYPSVDMRVRALGVGAALGDLGWVERLVWTAQPGDELRLPPRGFMSRLGFVVVTGGDADECRSRQAEVERLTEVEFEPLVAANDAGGTQAVGGQTRR